MAKNKIFSGDIITRKQLAYLSRKHGKENVVFCGRYISNPIDERLGINIQIGSDYFYIEDSTPKQIKNYVGAVSDWAKGLADLLEKEINSDSFYK